MGYVFWGMAFVLLDLHLDIGDRTVGLLPDWLGYWWLAKGFSSLEEEWDGFRKGRVPLLVLAAYSAVLYVMDLAALSVRGEALLWGLGLVAAVAVIAVTRLVCQGVCRLEEIRSCGMQDEKLRNFWIYLAVMQVFAAVLNWVPLVGTVCAVAVTVLALCWLAALWDARKRYDGAEGKL